MSHLQPVHPPLGVNPNYCMNKPTTLVMKEKVWSLSGDTFHIVDENKHEVIQCRGQTLSISDRKEFTTPQGAPLFSLRTRLLSIHKSFYAESPSGETIFEVKGKFSLGTSKMIATFNNVAGGQGRPVELLVKGDWFDRKATITWEGREVAGISRSFGNLRQIFGGQQTYFVSVAAGVDLALIAAICVCLDERENEKK